MQSGERKIIFKKMEHINNKLNDIIDNQHELSKKLDVQRIPPMEDSELEVLQSLQPHLIPTYFAIRQFQPCDATKLAEHTKRARAMESSYATQLCSRKVATKERKGKIVIYKLHPKLGFNLCLKH